MSIATQTVQILMDGNLVDVEGRIIAPGLAITPSMFHEGWSCISHLPSGKALIPARCPEHIEEAAQLLTGHPKPIDWTQPEEAIVADEALKDFVRSINDAVGHCYDCGPDAYADGWEMPGDRQHDNPIACPPDCYIAKDYTTADPNIGAVDSCSAHKPKTLDELRTAVERAR